MFRRTLIKKNGYTFRRLANLKIEILSEHFSQAYGDKGGPGMMLCQMLDGYMVEWTEYVDSGARRLWKTGQFEDADWPYSAGFRFWMQSAGVCHESAAKRLVEDMAGYSKHRSS